jgi:hypothetical protein
MSFLADGLSGWNVKLKATTPSSSAERVHDLL